jgi:hypothetical protein
VGALGAWVPAVGGAGDCRGFVVATQAPNKSEANTASPTFTSHSFNYRVDGSSWRRVCNGEVSSTSIRVM